MMLFCSTAMKRQICNCLLKGDCNHWGYSFNPKSSWHCNCTLEKNWDSFERINPNVFLFQFTIYLPIELICIWLTLRRNSQLKVMFQMSFWSNDDEFLVNFGVSWMNYKRADELGSNWLPAMVLFKYSRL